jgi:hypothetical protein
MSGDLLDATLLGRLGEGFTQELTIKNTFIEFAPKRPHPKLLSLGFGGLYRQTSEPADFSRCSQVTPSSTRQELPSTSDDAEASEELAKMDLDLLTDDGFPSTEPGSPRSPYEDMFGELQASSILQASPTMVGWAHPWMMMCPEQPQPAYANLRMQTLQAAAPLDATVAVEPELSAGHLRKESSPVLWQQPIASTVTLKNLPEDYTQWMLLEELRDASFQEGRDFHSLHMPIRADGKCTGICLIRFSDVRSSKQFLSSFSGRTLRCGGGAFTTQVSPSRPEGFVVFPQAASSTAKEPAAAPRVFEVRFCPQCGCRTAKGYKFCTQCGTSLSGIQQRQ